MKISICIPQYNRANFLIKNLQTIERQAYPNVEVIVSDDASTDNTEDRVRNLVPHYKFPLKYVRNQINLGYDRNFRQSIELASGDYIITIGNDDTINPNVELQFLVDFLMENNYPELGFCNFIEEGNDNHLVERAKATMICGTGYRTAMKYYSCFSFVGGLIYKRSEFQKYNTSKHDGSIYSQIYLGCLMVASGCTLFSICHPLVIKDIVVEDVKRNTYRDVLARKWKDYRVETGGLPSVINVLIDAFRDAGVLSQKVIYSIFRRIYLVTFPFWLIDYRSNKAFPAAIGLAHGMTPSRNHNFRLLNTFNKVLVWLLYIISSIAGLITPIFLFKRIKDRLYNRLKR